MEDSFQEDDDEEYFKLYELPKQRFALHSLAAFANSSVNDWIIKGVLPKAELAVIYGEPGSGKTFLALDMAFSIARGIEWQNKRIKQGNILYICAEGAGGFKKRLIAYSLHHKINLNDITNFDIIADAPNFLYAEDAALIISRIQTKPSCIIVDTFSRTMPGGNENSAEHVGMAISQCKTIHEATGAIIVLIHHSGKDAARGARGWSGLKGAADTEIEVIRIGDRRKGRISKQKDGDDEFEWGFKLDVVDLGTDDDGDMITSCVYTSLNEIHLDQNIDKPLGKIEKLVYDSFVLLNIYSVDIEEIVEICKKSIAYDRNKEDRRRDSVIRAINSLKSKGSIDIIDGHICKP